MKDQKTAILNENKKLIQNMIEQEVKEFTPGQKCYERGTN